MGNHTAFALCDWLDLPFFENNIDKPGTCEPPSYM